MKPENFCYWLQGYVEICGDMDAPTESEWKIMIEHLRIVDKLKDIESPNVLSSLLSERPYC